MPDQPTLNNYSFALSFALFNRLHIFEIYFISLINYNYETWIFLDSA